LARAKTVYICQECGGIHPRWAGRCDACGAWNTLVEEVPAPPAAGGTGTTRTAGRGETVAFTALSGAVTAPARRETGIAEFDRACGGGLVAGSAVLVGGDPGIGKSTVLLQVTASLARCGAACAYISGEEAVEQIKLRADRLGLADAPVSLATATDVEAIVHALDRAGRPDVLVIDSIQTMYLPSLESAPGTVAQVRACAQALIRHAKKRGLTLILVGHVTKEGQIAGPRVLEHMVDTVLYFEGERGHQFRILRAVKNRFGASDEIGVFEMSDRGLIEVANPSALFLGDRARAVSGAAVFAGLEGTRPVLVEIQALVAPSSMATPRRAVVGWDGARLAMVLAVLEARCGIAFSGKDVYLSVAGGLRITEPAADLAAAAALLSSLADVPLPADTVILGEIGLSGDIRPVSQTDVRLGEAAKLGFTAAWTPPARGQARPRARGALKPTVLRHVTELAAMISLDFGADSR
jgi:DNA repair protein RadA/Sms